MCPSPYSKPNKYFYWFAFSSVIGLLLVYASGILKAYQFRPLMYSLAGTIAVTALFAPGRWKEIAGNLLLSFTVLCLSWCALDLLLRPYYQWKILPKIAYRPHNLFVHRTIQYPDLLRYRKNITYEGETYGDLAAMALDPTLRETRRVVFFSDHLGFRNHPRIHERLIDTVVLGDSFFEGIGSSTDKNLIAWLNGAGRAAYNLSIPGSPWHELMNLGVSVDALKLKENAVVLWGIYEGNDLVESYGNELDFKEMTPSHVFETVAAAYDIFKKSSVSRILLERFDLWRKGKNQEVIKKSFLNGKTMLFMTYKNPAYEEVLDHKNYAKLKAVIHVMAQFAKERQLKVHVYLVPSKNTVYQWLLDDASPWSTAYRQSGFSRVVEELAVAEHLSFVDLTPGLIERSRVSYELEGKVLWWYDDTHWNHEGHEAVSRIILENLE